MRANHPRALALAGALVLVLAALVTTTSDGLAWSPVDGGSGLEAPAQPSAGDDGPRSSESGAQDGGGAAEDGPASGLPGFTRPLALTILVLALFILAVGVVAGVRLVLARRMLTGDVEPRTITDVDDDEPGPEPDSLSDSVSAGLRSVGEGGPRNGIVAAWIRLEDTITLAGFEPHDTETSAEVVHRALATWPVDEDAIGRLAELYREARFSDHELTEQHRDEAVDCLRRLREQLRTVGAR